MITGRRLKFGCLSPVEDGMAGAADGLARGVVAGTLFFGFCAVRNAVRIK